MEAVTDTKGVKRYESMNQEKLRVAFLRPNKIYSFILLKLVIFLKWKATIW